MYETYTRQSLPTKAYRELLGTALCVFNSNNAFVIENYLNEEPDGSWYQLIDKTSGGVYKKVKDKFLECGAETSLKLFELAIKKRDRIVHSFRITDSDGEQMLATKDKDTGEQFVITDEYLINFIKLNQKLSDELNTFRSRRST